MKKFLSLSLLTFSAITLTITAQNVTQSTALVPPGYNFAAEEAADKVAEQLVPIVRQLADNPDDQQTQRDLQEKITQVLRQGKTQTASKIFLSLVNFAKQPNAIDKLMAEAIIAQAAQLKQQKAEPETGLAIYTPGYKTGTEQAAEDTTTAADTLINALQTAQDPAGLESQVLKQEISNIIKYITSGGEVAVYTPKASTQEELKTDAIITQIISLLRQLASVPQDKKTQVAQQVKSRIQEVLEELSAQETAQEKPESKKQRGWERKGHPGRGWGWGRHKDDSKDKNKWNWGKLKELFANKYKWRNNRPSCTKGCIWGKHTKTNEQEQQAPYTRSRHRSWRS